MYFKHLHERRGWFSHSNQLHFWIFDTGDEWMMIIIVEICNLFHQHLVYIQNLVRLHSPSCFFNDSWLVHFRVHRTFGAFFLKFFFSWHQGFYVDTAISDYCSIFRFTCKVTLEIEEAQNLILEFVGEPLSKKKDAAESAAEGAFWYLQHEGYLPSSGNWHIVEQLSCHINPKAIWCRQCLDYWGCRMCCYR